MTDGRAVRRQIADAAKLMQPGGGSLETTRSCQALYAICVAQQDLIEALQKRLDQHSKGIRG